MTRKLSMFFKQTPTRANRTVAISSSASPEIMWGLGGPEEDHQLHHCSWTSRVGKQKEEEEESIRRTGENLSNTRERKKDV